jgi:hypothetical protein
MQYLWIVTIALFVVQFLAAPVSGDEPSGLRIAVFQVDATPPIGSPVAYAPTRKVEDPLSARGIVLLGVDRPIVLCAVDWLGIGNDGHQIFREKLAQAAETTVDRVTVHALHQHDAPRCDFRAEEILTEYGLGGTKFNSAFCRNVIENAATAVRLAIPEAKPVTHIGVGKAIVEKVASNRRIIGPDGKLVYSRMSRTTDPKLIAAPEGVIDPELKLISFWNEDQPIASLTYYATHPQSYYGNGEVTSEFVGLARARREASVPGVAHIHFNGASGDVAAGKYNDGSPQARVALTDRMEKGMAQAWESTVKTPISAHEIEWRVETVTLPVSSAVTVSDLQERLRELKENRPPAQRNLFYAGKMAYLERARNGAVSLEISCLKMKDVFILHLPGEMFVEYQLAAQKIRPDQTVCMAAYGDYGPQYIGTEVAFSQGGYETSPYATSVTPEAEKVLMNGIRSLLK